jgi:hypothetical protein
MIFLATTLLGIANNKWLSFKALFKTSVLNPDSLIQHFRLNNGPNPDLEF